MSRRTVISCDICETDRNGLPQNPDVSIAELRIEFKNHGNIKSRIVVDDCCAFCAKSIFDSIKGKINARKKEFK